MSDRMKRLLPILLCALALGPAAAQAESFTDMVRAELRPGWRSGTTHVAALHLRLAPGWKTYWRAPGDAGIPPVFDWRGARAIRSVEVEFPTPRVFWQSGMRSVGYAGEVVLPLRVSLRTGAGDARLRGVVDIGICEEVCIPHRLRVEALLPADQIAPDPVIAAALADLPFTAAEAGVRDVDCRVSPAEGGMTLTAAIAMPAGTGREETVIETADPQVWVAQPKTGWQDGRLVAQTRLMHVDGGVFALDRSGVRITVLGGRMPVDIRGCN